MIRVCARVGTSIVSEPEGRVMRWAITVFGTDCSGGMCFSCMGTLSTVKCWNHLVVDMNASAMLLRGAAVVGAVGCTQG